MYKASLVFYLYEIFSSYIYYQEEIMLIVVLNLQFFRLFCICVIILIFIYMNNAYSRNKNY